MDKPQGQRFVDPAGCELKGFDRIRNISLTSRVGLASIL